MQRSLERLKELCSENDIPLDGEFLKRLEVFLKELEIWRKRINLVSASSLDEIIERHVFDSLLGVRAFKEAGLETDAKVFADVGSGAGFPGLILAMYLRNSNFFLIEPRKKRCTFLGFSSHRLKLGNVKVVCDRVENFKLSVDYATMRAVVEPFKAVKMCSSLLKGGATLCIYRGKERFSKDVDGCTVREVSFEVKGVNFSRHFLFLRCLS